eukprot:GGOE01041483.1.p1 GENE.GGOE01041483.1~~GGOE01041483.1.p1  ORF type:complete len:360 (-),score=100.35 GGOE01041483.1:96-1175(-)
MHFALLWALMLSRWTSLPVPPATTEGPAALPRSAAAHLSHRQPRPDELLAPHCPHRFFQFINDFGGHSNQLLSLLNALEIARSVNLTLVLPVFMEGMDKGRPLMYNPWALYDFDLFREAGYCFVKRLPEAQHYPVLKHSAYRIFRVLPPNVSRPYHLLRPSQRVAREVRKMLRQLPENFTAVHRRIKMFTLFDCNRRGKGPHFVKPPFCWPKQEYVREAQAAMGATPLDPVFVATDVTKVPLVGVNSVRYHHGKLHPIYGTVVDWQVMTHAGYVIPHLSSSLSLNVCNTRRMMLPPRGCYNFHYCNDRPPNIAGWPCGTPVPGIATYLWTRRQWQKWEERVAIIEGRLHPAPAPAMPPT